MSPSALAGLLAEFERPEALVEAARKARASGYTRLDAFTPFAVEGLDEALELPASPLPWIVFAGAMIGLGGGYLLQWYSSTVHYPLNVGGRPFHSWPALVPVTFELTVLAASLAAVLGMLALNGLPRPHHPVFEVEAFARASRDRFFLYLESADPRFEPERARRELRTLGAAEVHDVPA